jgi:SNF2 family DNA or RNA helicase
MIRKALTYRYQIFAADMGLGKTLTAIEIIERMARKYGWDNDCRNECWFVGPRSALESVEVDLHKWGVNLVPRMLTYERVLIDGPDLLKTNGTPRMVVFDECTALKTPSAQRTVACQKLADAIRAEYATEGCVILLSGSPTAKRPSDIWSQAEIAWPGFLREGSLKAFEQRYAIVEEGQDGDGNKFKMITGWKDKEVSQLPARLDGLMSVYRKDDILNLPTRTFTRVHTPATARIKRVAKIITESSPNVITALTRLRTLSSGFQYKEDGEAGENGERAMIETACPKDDKLREYLAREEPRGRMIAFASFQGSIDRVKRVCQAEGWDVVTVDGRGWTCWDAENNRVDDHFLDFWSGNPNKTVFIGNPASCRFGLTLTEAKTIVVYDQNFSAEHRLQSLDRNFRIGQDEPVEVVDLLHLPVDELILDTLTENKRLEDLSLGLLSEVLDGGVTSEAVL